MAHGGDEPAFRSLGAFGLRAGNFERAVLHFPVTDVAENGNDLALAGAAIARPAAHVGPDELTIGAADAQLEQALFGEAGGVGDGREVGRPVDDVDPVEQAIAQQVGRTHADQGLSRRRDGQDRAVMVVMNNDICRRLRQHPMPILFGVKERMGGADEQLDAKRKTRGIERGRHDAECGQRALLLGCNHRARQQAGGPKCQQQAGSGQRQNRRHGDNTAGARKRCLQRHHHQPDCGEGSDTAGAQRDQRCESGQRQGGQHVRAFIAARAGQVIDNQDRSREP